MLNNLILAVGVDNTIQNRSKLAKDFETLDTKSQQVLVYRFSSNRLTLKQAGEQLNMVDTRVRQIEAKALVALRKKARWW